MNFNRTTLFAALLSAGIATAAVAQSTAPTPPAKAPSPAATPATTAAPPSAGSTGMDKGAGTGAGATGSAAAPKSAAASAASSLSRSERRFVEKAMQGGMEEVELAKIALDKAQNAKVKEFAKRLVDDHSKANAQLTKIAAAKGVTPPAAVDAGHRRKMESMAKKSGTDFDRNFMDDMVDHHQKDVRDFRSISKSAKDADVKAFATSTLPTLEEHLTMAKATESAVKSAGRDKKTASAASSATTGSGSSASTGAGPTGTAKSTATPGKNTAATTGTAGPGTGMPASSAQSTGTAPQPPGSASDAKATAPTK